MTEKQAHIRIVTSLAEVSPTAWNDLISGPKNPFVSHEFLHALETSQSAVAESGWLAQHLLLETGDGKLLGALPCYLKNHSQGEYVFDHGWADAFMRAGGQYYPKLQCSVPFTPASGPRLLVPDTEDAAFRRSALLEGLKQLCERLNVSSAHITFMNEADWQAADGHGYLQRTDQQFHWHNDGYDDFDAFLAALSSRKRKNIRKERAAAHDIPGIKIDWLTGEQLTEPVWDRFFEFYQDTGARKWGQPYLTREFFTQAGKTMADRVLLVMASLNDRYIAGAINFVGEDCVYGRHWGCVEDHPFLHFEVCYYQAMEYAIQNRIPRVEAGAQGGHKLARGYVPVKTLSSHWITHEGFRDAVGDYLREERRQVDREGEMLKDHLPFRKQETD